MYLACSGGKGTVGVYRGSFGSCISTGQCKGLRNREQWAGLDIAALLNCEPVEHETVGAGRRFNTEALGTWWRSV